MKEEGDGRRTKEDEGGGRRRMSGGSTHDHMVSIL